ncbi:hypothetical protein CPB85DRAFT_1261904 [Mucidula mucida]|nr:hypothetical protein CPB85DRAFT_1261904 [Mucidula mucida]
MPPKKKGPKDATSKSGAATIAEQATCRSAMSTTPNSCAPNIRTGLKEQTADIRGRKRNNSEVSTASKAPTVKRTFTAPLMDDKDKDEDQVPPHAKGISLLNPVVPAICDTITAPKLSVKLPSCLVKKGMKLVARNIKRRNAGRNTTEEDEEDDSEESNNVSEEDAEQNDDEERARDIGDASRMFDTSFNALQAAVVVQRSKRLLRASDAMSAGLTSIATFSSLMTRMSKTCFCCRNSRNLKLELAYAAAQQEAEEEEDVPKLVRRKNPVSAPRLGKKFDNKKATFPSAMACPGSHTSVGPNGFLPYTEIVPGTPHLLISAQTGKVKSTLKLGCSKVKRAIVIAPANDLMRRTLTPHYCLFNSSSNHLGYVGNGHIADRLQRGDQEQYIDPMTLHVHHRFVLARSSIKAQARHIPGILNIPNTDGGRRIARGLLESFDYVNGTDDSSFMGRHSGLLTSSIATGSRASEREVTVLMVALVATGIHAVLSDLGHNTHDEFSGSNMSSVFLRHTTVLEEYKLRKPNSFHKLMHGLYLDATNSMPNATHGMTKAESSRLFLGVLTMTN